MEVVECSYRDVRHLASAGAREAVSIKDSRNTIWFALRNRDGVVVGSMGIIVGPSIRLKGWFVRPQYRGAGWGRALMERFLAYDPAKPAELVSRTPEVWEARGFARTRQAPNGSWWLTRAPA